MSTKENNNFKDMSVNELKKYLQDRGISISGYLKSSLVEIASAVDRMALPIDPNFEKDESSKGNNNESLIIHDMQISNPYSMKVENNFINAPPFGLYDIFNYLIYYSTEYDKQGLAAYKSFGDYRLFEDGYVESLRTAWLNQEGIHVFVAQVRPFMKTKTDEGKEFYDLWFVLEGKGPNKGSVLKARCKCKGGQDGGCKHIAAAMYSLDDLLNSRDKDSVTSGPCLWVKKPNSGTKPCDMKDLKIEKIKKPSNKKSKRKRVFRQSIDVDVRNPEDRKALNTEDLRAFTKKMSEFQEDQPAILTLLRKLYAKECSVEQADCESKSVASRKPVLKERLETIMRKNPRLQPEDIPSLLLFSEEEIEDVSRLTLKQWECEEWYLHRAGFITASMCHRVYTRQMTLVKTETADASKVIESIAVPKIPSTSVSHSIKEPRNGREWGLLHEESARHAYRMTASHIHHKLKLVSKGFLISKTKPFLGASLDNIQTCECKESCGDAVVEYKCPWKHRHLPPKEAFLTPEIGGVKDGNVFSLKATCPYYFQVQLQMFVSELTLCNFVVWTEKGIFTLPVQYDATFMSNMCDVMEKFWMVNVLPFLMSEALPEQETYKRAASPRDVHVDLTSSPVQPSSPRPSCINVGGIQLYAVDIETTKPEAMINDKVIAVMFQEIPCTYPIISTFFYSTLSGEQDVGTQASTRLARIQSAEKFFLPTFLHDEYVIIPINRSLHWLLAVITPWHLLIMDSLTWDIATRQTEIMYITSFMDHLCKKNEMSQKTCQLTNHLLKVPQQQASSNNCGIYMTMFVHYFSEDLKDYEKNPEAYIGAVHQWFDHEVAEEKRAKTRTYLKSLFY